MSTDEKITGAMFVGYPVSRGVPTVTADDLRTGDHVAINRHVTGYVREIVEVPNRGLLRITIGDTISGQAQTVSKRPRTDIGMIARA